jgi:hypothetical protein
MWTRGIGVGGVSGGLGVRGIGGGGIVGGMRILLVDGGASGSTICQHRNHRVEVLGPTQPLSRPQKSAGWWASPSPPPYLRSGPQKSSRRWCRLSYGTL